MSYGKIGLRTVAVTYDLLPGMPLVLLKENSSAFGTVFRQTSGKTISIKTNSI